MRTYGGKMYSGLFFFSYGGLSELLAKREHEIGGHSQLI